MRVGVTTPSTRSALEEHGWTSLVVRQGPQGVSLDVMVNSQNKKKKKKDMRPECVK